MSVFHEFNLVPSGNLVSIDLESIAYFKAGSSHGGEPPYTFIVLPSGSMTVDLSYEDMKKLIVSELY